MESLLRKFEIEMTLMYILKLTNLDFTCTVLESFEILFEKCGESVQSNFDKMGGLDRLDELQFIQKNRDRQR